MKIRIDKLLSNMGIGSRKEIKQDGKNGKISLNGTAIKDVSQIIDTEVDKITYLGEAILYQEFVYLMMNKPPGVVSATQDNFDDTVIDILEPQYQAFQPFPVGRLDKDTHGLLLITNNGKLSFNLLSPKKHVDKTYFATISEELTEKDIKAFEKGVLLEKGYKCLPAKLVIDKEDPKNCLVTIKEGKFHQIKRMFAAQDKEVLFLKRISMGPLTLDETLESGEARELNEEELALLADYMK